MTSKKNIINFGQRKIPTSDGGAFLGPKKAPDLREKGKES